MEVCIGVVGFDPPLRRLITMQLVALYHMSREPAAAPWAAAGETPAIPEKSVNTAAERLAQPTVPERNPLALGGATGEKKMMPDATAEWESET